MSEPGFTPNVIPFHPVQNRIPFPGIFTPCPEVYTFCFWGVSQFLDCIRARPQMGPVGIGFDPYPTGDPD